MYAVAITIKKCENKRVNDKPIKINSASFFKGYDYDDAKKSSYV